MAKFGPQLLQGFHRDTGKVVDDVQVYVDPDRGVLCADVILANGVSWPFLLDVDPAWELTGEGTDGFEPLDQDHEAAIKRAADERSTWDM